MKTKIKVTAHDIVRGRPGSPCHCMLARAIRRTFKRKTVEVFPNGIAPGWGKCDINEVEVLLPVRANDKAIRFDTFDPEPGDESKLPVKGRARLKIIKPFSFTLQVPAL